MREQDLFDWDWIRANRSAKWERLPIRSLAERARQHPHDPVLGDGRISLTAEEIAHRAAGIAARLLEEGSDQPVVIGSGLSPARCWWFKPRDRRWVRIGSISHKFRLRRPKVTTCRCAMHPMCRASPRS